MWAFSESLFCAISMPTFSQCNHYHSRPVDIALQQALLKQAITIHSFSSSMFLVLSFTFSIFILESVRDSGFEKILSQKKKYIKSLRKIPKILSGL